MQRQRFTTPDGVSIAAYDFGGGGPDVVFAHATGYHALVWQPVIERLVDSYRCLAFDSRGHGDSGKSPGDDYDWGRLGIDLTTVVDGFGLRRPLGVGHSCGGALLLQLEARRPGTFRALYGYEPVVVPTGAVEAAVLAAGKEWSARNSMAESARRRREIFASRQEAFDNYASKPMYLRCRPEGLWAYVDHGFDDLPDGTVRLKCRAEDEARVFSMGTVNDAFSELTDVSCPVTLARGSLSEFPFDAGTQSAVASRLPRVRTETLEGLSHLGPLEDPGLIAAHLRASFTEG